TNVAKFTRMLQGQRDMMTVARTLLSEVAPLVNAQHGLFYVLEGEARDGAEDGHHLKLVASYAFKERKHLAAKVEIGQGLVGQAAFEKQRILVSNVPGDYVTISSGLGAGSPAHVVVIPVVFEGQVKAVIELASFARFTPVNLQFLEQLTESVGI